MKSPVGQQGGHPFPLVVSLLPFYPTLQLLVKIPGPGFPAGGNQQAIPTGIPEESNRLTGKKAADTSNAALLEGYGQVFRIGKGVGNPNGTPR